MKANKSSKTCKNNDITMQITFQYDNIGYKNDDIKCTYQAFKCNQRIVSDNRPTRLVASAFDSDDSENLAIEKTLKYDIIQQWPDQLDQYRLHHITLVRLQLA